MLVNLVKKELRKAGHIDRPDPFYSYYPSESLLYFGFFPS